MSNLTICRWCGKSGHLIGDCPERKPVVRVKKPWVKPTITKWVKAGIVDIGSNLSTERVDTSTEVVDKKELRRQQQREWARKKRAKG
jgi:hypothetical protein